EDGIRDLTVTGVQTCALPISVLAAVGRALGEQLAVVLLDGDVAVDALLELAAGARDAHDLGLDGHGHGGGDGDGLAADAAHRVRSEERRVGKGGMSWRWCGRG